jgi:phosphoribosyl-ATP pyrophosphohydrolase/phosphoribosyl-AMP cyclohydrolase
MSAPAPGLDGLDFAKGNGTVTVVTQDAVTGAVLMVAQADREALERTVATGQMHYRSRSRGLWRKGETSGHVQAVRSLTADCDGDTVLAVVEQSGPACHTDAPTCFGAGGLAGALARLDRTIAARAGDEHASGSYTRTLLADRNLRLKKIGEEMSELVTALADGDRARAVEEAADVVYHVLVALRAVGAGVADVEAELDRRGRPSAEEGR